MIQDMNAALQGVLLKGWITELLLAVARVPSRSSNSPAASCGLGSVSLILRFPQRASS